MNIFLSEKGHKLVMPCHFKMKAFKFLAKAYGISDDLKEIINYDDKFYKLNCNHDS